MTFGINANPEMSAQHTGSRRFATLQKSAAAKGWRVACPECNGGGYTYTFSGKTVCRRCKGKTKILFAVNLRARG